MNPFNFHCEKGETGDDVVEKDDMDDTYNDINHMSTTTLIIWVYIFLSQRGKMTMMTMMKRHLIERVDGEDKPENEHFFSSHFLRQRFMVL